MYDDDERAYYAEIEAEAEADAQTAAEAAQAEYEAEMEHASNAADLDGAAEGRE